MTNTNTTVKLRKDIKDDFWKRCKERGEYPTHVIRDLVYDLYMDWLMEDTEDSETKEVMKQC